jgi:hypothetical protein
MLAHFEPTHFRHELPHWNREAIIVRRLKLISGGTLSDEHELSDLRIDRKTSRLTPPAVRPLLLKSSRCQRRSVAGVTRKQDHRSHGIDRLAAASSTRSMNRSFGGPVLRRRTRS